MSYALLTFGLLAILAAAVHTIRDTVRLLKAARRSPERRRERRRLTA